MIGCSHEPGLQETTSKDLTQSATNCNEQEDKKHPISKAFDSHEPSMHKSIDDAQYKDQNVSFLLNFSHPQKKHHSPQMFSSVTQYQELLKQDA